MKLSTALGSAIVLVLASWTAGSMHERGKHADMCKRVSEAWAKAQAERKAK